MAPFFFVFGGAGWACDVQRQAGSDVQLVFFFVVVVIINVAVIVVAVVAVAFSGGDFCALFFFGREWGWGCFNLVLVWHLLF